MATYACNWTEQTQHYCVHSVPHLNPHLLSTSYNLQRLIQLSLNINSYKVEADKRTLILSLCLVLAGIARYTYSAVARHNRTRFPILRNVQTIAVTKGLRTSVHQALKRPERESDHPSPFNT